MGFAVKYARDNPDSDVEYNNLLCKFPYKINEFDQCEKLGEDNLCTVYHDRPLICRIDDYYDKYKKDKTTREQFHEEVHQACVKLREL